MKFFFIILRYCPSERARTAKFLFAHYFYDAGTNHAREAKADIGLPVGDDDYDPGINCTKSVFLILPEYVLPNM